MTHRPLTSVRRSAALASLVLGALVATGPAAATDMTGFLPAEGEGAVALSYTDESYDEFWRGADKRPTPPPLGEITNRSTSLWLSYGLDERLALLVTAAHVDTEGDGTGGLEDSGPQDLSALLAGRLWHTWRGDVEHSLVGAVGVRAPMESYVANAPVARGDNTTDGLLRLVYLLRSGRFYVSQQVGFDLRGDDAPDGWPLYTELGWSAGRLTWIVTYSRLIADDGTDIGDPGFTFPSNREETERLGGKLIGGLNDRWSLFAGGFVTLDGRNSGNAEGLSLGIIRKF